MSPHDIAARAVTVAQTLRGHAGFRSRVLTAQAGGIYALSDTEANTLADLAEVVAALAVEFANMAEPVA